MAPIANTFCFIATLSWICFLLVNRRSHFLRGRALLTIVGVVVAVVTWMLCGTVVGIANDYTWLAVWEGRKTTYLIVLLIVEPALGLSISAKR